VVEVDDGVVPVFPVVVVVGAAVVEVDDGVVPVFPVVVVVAAVVVEVDDEVVVVPVFAVVVVVGAVVVAPVEVVLALVVEVDPPDDSPANRIVTVALSLFWSPNINVHTTPAACWAAVGGHGYFAASVAGAFPALSADGQTSRAGGPPHGGPVVPPTTV